MMSDEYLDIMVDGGVFYNTPMYADPDLVVRLYIIRDHEGSVVDVRVKRARYIDPNTKRKISRHPRNPNGYITTDREPDFRMMSYTPVRHHRDR